MQPFASGFLLLIAATEAQPYRLARAIFQELIEIDTRHESTRAAESGARLLMAAGFPAEDVQVVGPKPDKMNLVARLRGRGPGNPVLLLAHLDVVEARREDWSIDPFRLLEKDGFFYGRGTADDKSMAAIFLASLIQYRREGLRPDRDIVVALTADEENEADNGVAWLFAHRPELIAADMVINEGGGGRIRNGRYLYNAVQTTEKTYVSFLLETTDRGGHSAVPRAENPIYRMAAALQRLSRHRFSVRLNDTTRAFFGAGDRIENGRVAADMKAVARTGATAAVQRLSQDPFFNAQMRTTCVPTRMEAGHADNALPQTVRATVNCRLLPGESATDVQQTLAGALADPRISLSAKERPMPGPATRLGPSVLRVIERITSEIWRAGGIPAYGVSGLFHEMNDVRAHGRDERIGVRQFYQSRLFLYRLAKALAGEVRS